MHDKYVRRRRAVLAVLVAVSLILLTAYFGKADNSPLHSIQRGIVAVFTPIQQGASTVLSPVRDLDGWVSSTLHAKSQNAQLVKENRQLENQVAQLGSEQQEYAQLSQMLKLNNRFSLSQYGPVAANVTFYNPQVWYETIKIDKGIGSGIRDGDPVLSSRGLVGHITTVGDNFAVVSELSSPGFAVGARILDPSRKGGVGTLTPAVGNPTRLQVNYLPADAQIQGGDDLVVTAGLCDNQNSSDDSPYPPGIPIGRVSNFDYNQLANSHSVDVSPNVNLRDLSAVEVLTKGHCPPAGTGAGS